jgi:hypothetical protein
MNVTVTVDPDDPADLARAQRLLERLGVPPSTTPEEDLRERVRSILRGYGTGRLSYVKTIAEASPTRVPVDRLLALFESPKAIGGTHSSIERSWRALGGTGMFIDTDRQGNSRMEPALAQVALEVLTEIELEEG